MRRLIAVLCTIPALVFASTLAAAEPPEPASANAVVEYYYSDAGRPVLMDFKLCNGVYEDGPDKHDCLEELDPAAIETGTEVYLWMKFLVPRDAEAGILTQLNHKGVTRRTFNRDLGGALRYRTWHKATFEQAGTWEVAVLYEGADGVEKLHSATLNVK